MDAGIASKCTHKMEELPQWQSARKRTCEHMLMRLLPLTDSTFGCSQMIVFER